MTVLERFHCTRSACIHSNDITIMDVMMFADDTKIFGNPGFSLQLDINRADEWAKNGKIKSNVDKCKVSLQLQ